MDILEKVIEIEASLCSPGGYLELEEADVQHVYIYHQEVAIQV